MQKILSLFQRNYETDRLVRDEVVPGAEWVLAGEGVATRKFDGTCAKFEKGKLYKRYDAKHGKPAPEGFIPAQEADPVTGHWPGWLEISDLPNDQWFQAAFSLGFALGDDNGNPEQFIEGQTYELCGPKVQSNPESLTAHFLIRHGAVELPDCPRTFAGIKQYLSVKNIEGIVWHHPDGRLVKIKKKDFGFKR